MGANRAQTRKKKRKTSTRAPTHDRNYYDVMSGEFEELHVIHAVLEENCKDKSKIMCEYQNKACIVL
jgi:hypothetical protein